MNWIIENAIWIATSVFGGISVAWNYFTTKKNRKLSEALQEADVQIRESNVDSAGIDVRVQETNLQQNMLDYSAKVFAQFEELANQKMVMIQENFDLDIARTKAKHEELEELYEQARQAISTHELYIANLKRYTLYLKGILKSNHIKYKDEHEIS